jgi:hypothetical protein
MDGSFNDGPFRVTGVIGHERRFGEREVVELASIGRVGAESYWPVTMAYFALGSDSETPNYEITLRLLNDGVVSHMTQDFGAYSLAFEPVSITKIEEPGC